MHTSERLCSLESRAGANDVTDACSHSFPNPDLSDTFDMALMIERFYKLVEVIVRPTVFDKRQLELKMNQGMTPLLLKLQGYVSSRRRRQRRIAELVTLVEQLEQYLTILRSESTTLQSDIQSLGKLNSDFSALAQQLQQRNTAIDGENIALEGFLPVWSSKHQLPPGTDQTLNQPNSLGQPPVPDVQSQALAELLAQQHQLPQHAPSLHLHVPFMDGLQAANAGASFPSLSSYSIDHAALPLAYHPSALPGMQQLQPGLPHWEGVAQIPGMDSTSSSEPGQGSSTTATSSASILPEPPLLRLGSRSFGQETQPRPGQRQASMGTTEDTLISSLQQMSLLSVDITDPARAVRGCLNLPPMPADVWRGVNPTAIVDAAKSSQGEGQQEPSPENLQPGTN